MIRGVSKQCIHSLPKASSANAASFSRGFATSKPEAPKESQSKEQTTKDEAPTAPKEPNKTKATASHKTMAELDEEMKMKMSGLAGDGGESGVEYEDGKPVAMKRSVKNNMFRYI
ncbi:hypothetical protein SCUP515_00724 [Seiridium cupressi]|uniref:Uncharacterized protein n=1 Tax=Seiridium unicorne TaxID=138068 RepID=A0ABR2VBR2_9PEZI